MTVHGSVAEPDEGKPSPPVVEPNSGRGNSRPTRVQAADGHSTITQTMDHYSHTVIGKPADAVTASADLTPGTSNGRGLESTGTYDTGDTGDTGPRTLASDLAKRTTQRVLQFVAVGYRVGP